MEQAGLTPNAPAQGSGWATWSLVLGIIAIPLFILFIPGFLALVFGIVALVKIGNSAGRLKGKAIVGIVLGGLSFVFVPLVGIVVAIAIPSFVSSHKMAEKSVAEATLPREVFSNDGVCRVTVPGDWAERVDLHDEASIQVGNARNEVYLIVLTDSKLDFDEMTLEEHSQLTRKRMMENINNDRIIGAPKEFEINGRPAVQYEIRGSVDKIKIVYLHVTIEGREYFHQVLAWTLSSAFERNQVVLESVVNTFEELGD